MLKDNHWAAADGIHRGSLVNSLPAACMPDLPIEVEVDSLEQLQTGCSLWQVDWILLDNFTFEQTARGRPARRDARSKVRGPCSSPRAT